MQEIRRKEEYKNRHDWVGKVIHWDLCKRLTFDQTEKLYTNKPESVQENEIHTIVWELEIQTDHLIQVCF